MTYPSHNTYSSTSKAMLWTLLCALGCAIGCTDSKTGAKDRTKPAPAVDLQDIRKRGVLRLLTRNNGNTYFVLRGNPLGFDYEMAERFAQSIGVKLEVVVPPGWNDLIPMLTNGDGDLIGAGMNVTEERAKQVLFTRPYGLSQMHVVWGKGQKRIRSATDLSGKQVHVRQGSTYYGLLRKLSDLFESTGQRRVDIIIEGETLETEQILTDVAAGKVPYTLCDYHICAENKARLPGLVIGPAIGNPEPLAWAVHPNAHALKEAIDRFFADQKVGDFDEVYERYYGDGPNRSDGRAKGNTGRISGGKLSAFDDIFRQAAQSHALDWRLLAAIAFQESEFEARHRSWKGGRGLFGMHPKVAREHGAKDLNDPKQAAEAAAANLAALAFKFASIKDDEQRMKFATASYQCGENHVTDAQELARREGLKGETWDDVAKVLPLLALREYASKADHGYVQGADTVRYVQEVWERYRAYRHALGERDARTAQR